MDGDGEKTTIHLRFPGQYFDRESGLYYNHHRDYDPNLGRYIQSDPIGLEGGINRYAYVEGNPVNFIDPSGLYACTGGGSSGGDIFTGDDIIDNAQAGISCDSGGGNGGNGGGFGSSLGNGIFGNGSGPGLWAPIGSQGFNSTGTGFNAGVFLLAELGDECSDPTNDCTRQTDGVVYSNAIPLEVGSILLSAERMDHIRDCLLYTSPSPRD